MAGESRISEADLADLIGRMDEAARAYIRGDLPPTWRRPRPWGRLALMGPFGGETGADVQYDDDAIERTRGFFASGEARLDVRRLLRVRRPRRTGGGRAPTGRRSAACPTKTCPARHPASSGPGRRPSWQLVAIATRNPLVGRSPFDHLAALRSRAQPERNRHARAQCTATVLRAARRGPCLGRNRLVRRAGASTDPSRCRRSGARVAIREDRFDSAAACA